MSGGGRGIRAFEGCAAPAGEGLGAGADEAGTVRSSRRGVRGLAGRRFRRRAVAMAVSFQQLDPVEIPVEAVRRRWRASARRGAGWMGGAKGA